MSARLRRWIAAALAGGLLPAAGAHADWNQANDEANRQRMMSEMRANAAAADRANEESQRRQQAAADARRNSSSASSGGGSSSSSPGGAYTPYRPLPEGPRSVVATYSFTVHRQESQAATVARIEGEAKAGQAQSQFNLGRIYYTGYGAPHDDAKARQWFATAADQGHAGAQAQYGLMLFHGQGGPADRARGLAYLKKAADQGDVHGQGLFGALSLDAANPAAQPQLVDYLVKAADQGDLVAQNALGRIVYPLGVAAPADPARTIKYLRFAAAQHDPSSMYDLSLHCLSGQGVAADQAQGIALMKAAAQAEYPEAQGQYGFIQVRGLYGVAQDLPAGVQLLRAADQNGSSNGAYYLGLLTEDGRGVAQDIGAAVALYRRAAERGQPDGQARYGMALIRGVGAAQDVAAGARMIKASADGGSDLGQEYLARLYYDGVGLPKDRRLAAQWFGKAAQNGNAAAANALKTDPELSFATP